MNTLLEMVILNQQLLCSIKKHLDGKFIDSLRLNIRGGHGGNGVPRYGGVGGQGGCVYFIAKHGLTLRHIMNKYSTKRIHAISGEDSSKIRILGRRGIDERIEVPVGVQILDDTGKVLGDLGVDGETCIAAEGGIGGCSGTSFIGKPGASKTVILNLKLIADIGLVGFPNAGKSTLLKAISNASPRIATYPFTTIRPQIGIIKYSDHRSVSVADLPGLIEGAHANIGMGHNFLKHIERTRLLLMVVDIFGFQLSPLHERHNCLQNIYALNRELELYDETILDKSIILLVNKMDLNGAIHEFKKIEPILNDLKKGIDNCTTTSKPNKLITFKEIIPISAKYSSNINLVKNNVRAVLDEIVIRLDSDKLRKVLDIKLRQRK